MATVHINEIQPGKAIVPVIGMNDDGPIAFLGTGFFVADGEYLITCDHVFYDWNELVGIAVAEEKSYISYVAEFVIRDRRSDIAILRVPSFKPPWSFEVTEQAKILYNMPVITYEYGTTEVSGSSVLFNPATRLGNITRRVDLRDLYDQAGYAMLELSFPALKGASGAPVLMSEPPFELFGMIKANVNRHLMPAQITSVLDTKNKIYEEIQFMLPQAVAVNVAEIYKALCKI